MRRTIILGGMLLLVVLAGPVEAGDKEDVQAVIDEYCRLEGTGDLMAQAKLMTPDRVFIAIGGRNTDQASNMQVQQMNQDVLKQMDPGAKLVVTARDPIIMVNGNMAVASFYRYWARIWSAEFIKEQNGAVPPSPSPNIVTLVLVKQGREWKIAHTHGSPLFPPGN